MMLQSALFGKTSREAPADATSANHRLLVQGAFIDQLLAGVYSYLPLGFRVLKKIESIIREEMNAIGGQEMLMPALQPRELWEKTGRWDALSDVMYQFQDHGKRDIGLGVTHEEVVADLARQFVTSYRDLPRMVYQIQTKYRFELRPKAGLNRGREFPMKDLYSLHADSEDLDQYYERVKESYQKIYSRCGLEAKVVQASGGSFTNEYTHEFQVLTDAGEDTVYFCDQCSFAQNKEIVNVKKGATCPSCGTGVVQTASGVEVGNIFKLGTQYSTGVGAFFADAKGERKPIVMASYGIGLSRVMGTVVEVHHDAEGIKWPATVAPFHAHVLPLSDRARPEADTLAQTLTDDGWEIFLDDREASPGEKLKDADLLGMPVRVVLSDRTIGTGNVEVKERASEKATLHTLAQLRTILQRELSHVR